MKLLLTSAGVKNDSIRKALVEMLGKPIADCDALCIPTAGYGHPHGSPAGAWRFVSGREPRCPMVELGWKSAGLLELTALPHIARERWTAWIRSADILLVNGGDAVFLAHWMRQSGLADLLPSLGDKVWMGLSAGSMVMTPRVGAAFVETKPSITGDDKGLGVVDFSIFPHLDCPDLPENTLAEAQRWASGLGNPSYAIDDDTAIQVVGGTVKVISEGNWQYFAG
jgi:dipeptidase E